MSTANTTSKSNQSASLHVKIKPQISCPHCWHEFQTDKILFISESPDLLGDSKLGDAEQLRFLPYRFGVGGEAFDAHGVACHKLACPNCHLQIPRPLLHMSSFFISIVGAPAAGKSYFFTSMVWQLRKTMTRDFCMNFTDADPTLNKRIRDYEMKQFMGGDAPDVPVAIEKTDIQGDIYNNTFIDGHLTSLAQPFSFTISPLPSYPFPQHASNVTQAVCMYDNAGESFLPGADNVSQPVTRHLATSDAILFLFDPTQDLRFKNTCREIVNDPQMNPALGGDVRRSKVNQSSVLTEMITRIRTHSHTPPHEKIKTPIIIVLTKYDAWHQLVNFPHYNNPWQQAKNYKTSVYNISYVNEYSQILRELLLELIPDLVGTAEANAEKVTYIAVSATGTAPEVGQPDKDGKRPLLYQPANIKPVWVEVPFFHAQTLAGKYCVPVVKS
ncbi:MAG: hypothetical protein LBK82_15625 [Planctomycetaceae bacterium]|jgi:hypothetical protein|nr:hypothetical protein [Planctomycetaceae bacterium]